MQSCGLGLRCKTVEPHSHNPLWKSAFIWLADEIRAKLGSLSGYRIAHFGSTSIREIAAKPVLDVMVIFTEQADLNASIPLFEELGFIHKGDAISKMHGRPEEANRQGFSFYDTHETIAFIIQHVLVSNHPDVAKHLRFRDRLRQNSNLAKEYENFKLSLNQNVSCRYDYSRNKSQFVSKIL